jgi:hypothetical protein
MEPLSHDHGETLPNFIKKTHPRKGEKKKQKIMTKVKVGKVAPKR